MSDNGIFFSDTSLINDLGVTLRKNRVLNEPIRFEEIVISIIEPLLY